MRSPACLFWAVSAVILAGCGGNVDVGAGGGGSGGSGAGASSSTAGASGAMASSSSAGGSTGTETTSSTSAFDDGCPEVSGDVFWVDVQVGGEEVHLASDCPYYNKPYGPMAYAWTNGKSGPQWYFSIEACEAVIPEGSQKGPAISIVADIPEGAMVTVPYTTTGTIGYITESQVSLEPVLFPSIVFNQFGPEHTLVTGKFTGTVTWTDGQQVPITGQISVCRRSNIIAL
jgi:hypothetical protein